MLITKMSLIKNALSETGRIFKNKRMLIVLILGILGVMLIIFSKGASVKTSKGDVEIGFDEKQYVENLEKRLKEVLKQMEGVGECEVMLTLDTGPQYVYATSGKSAASESVNKSQSVSTSQNNKEDSYILVRDESGGENPILLTTVEPKIKGAAILCDGGDKVAVKQRIVETVSALLNVSSNKVCVIKKGN